MSEGFDWRYTLSLFGDERLWRALLTVLELSALSWSVGVTLGMGLALMRRSSSRVVRAIASPYVWFFRNVPLLVLIVFVFNAPLVFPSLHGVLSIPFWSAFIAITLTEIAYTAEIHRGGLLSVSSEQYDAGRALGLSRWQVFAHVVLPQALRVSLPALRNDLVSIVKLTSLASAISLPELLYTGQDIYSSNFKVLETLTAVTVLYVALVSVLDLLLRAVEVRLDVQTRGAAARPQDLRADPAAATSARRARSSERSAVKPRSASVRPLISVANVTKTFGGQLVLKGVSLDVCEGEVLSIIGPSGSGKTTLLRALNRLESIDSGSIAVAGVPQARLTSDSPRSAEGRTTVAHRRQVGMVFQRFNLFPHKTVMGNLMLAPTVLKVAPRDELRQRAEALLRRVGLTAQSHKYPHQLSGGQQQRVAIARALMMQPRVVLFDEPTSALDRELVGEVLEVIRGLADDGLTMVVISHELRFVEEVADWVVFMDDGVVVEQGDPEMMRRPREERTRAFLGHQRAADELPPVPLPVAGEGGRP